MGKRRIYVSDEDIQEMIALRNSGMTYKKIGEKFGVSKDVIINRIGTDNITRYIKNKLKVLKELYVSLNNEEIEHLRSLKTESDIDHYAHRLIMKDVFKR